MNIVKTNQKTQNKKTELISRTAQIFGLNPVDKDPIEQMFVPSKSSLVVTNNSPILNEFINQNIKEGNLYPIEWAKDSYVINQNKELFTHSDHFENGNIYIQNISSLIPVIELNPQANEIILDMCAAPGGKTIQIARMANNQATIIVNDENPTRITAMKNLFQRYKVSINSFYTQPAQYLSKHLPLEYFDKILLDAPCSGEGMINISDSKSINYWSTKKIKRLSKLQKKLIAEAYKLLKPNGTLVYSTCTLAPEENEEVIFWATNNFKDLYIEQISIKDSINQQVQNKEQKIAFDGLTSWKNKPLNKDCSKCVRIKPTEYTEAFFVCKIKKGSLVS